MGSGSEVFCFFYFIHFCKKQEFLRYLRGKNKILKDLHVKTQTSTVFYTNVMHYYQALCRGHIEDSSLLAMH